MQLRPRGRVVPGTLAILAMLVAGCGRTPDRAAIPETRELIADPARLSLVAGASGTVRARATDAAGQPIEGARLEFSASDPRMLRVDAHGKVTSLGPAGQAAISIISGARSVTVPVDVTAGPARKFEATGESTLEIVAGKSRKDAASVRLVDAFGNPVANTPVMFEAAIEPPLSLSTSTGADGIATITLPAVTRAGRFTLSAHTTGDAPVSLPLEVKVSAASPATLEAVRILPSGPVALVPDFETVLRVRDTFGNPVPNASVRWRTASGSASFDPPQSLSDADGLVRTRWHLTALKGRRATLRAYVVEHETVRFQSWIALER